MYIIACRAHFCHLLGLGQVGHSPRETSGSDGTLNRGPCLAWVRYGQSPRGTSGTAGTLDWSPMWLGSQSTCPSPMHPWHPYTSLTPPGHPQCPLMPPIPLLAPEYLHSLPAPQYTPDIPHTLDTPKQPMMPPTPLGDPSAPTYSPSGPWVLTLPAPIHPWHPLTAPDAPYTP